MKCKNCDKECNEFYNSEMTWCWDMGLTSEKDAYDSAYDMCGECVDNVHSSL